MARESSHRLLLKLASSLLHLHINYHHFVIVAMFVLITITLPFIFGVQSFIYTSICYGNNDVYIMHLRFSFAIYLFTAGERVKIYSP